MSPQDFGSAPEAVIDVFTDYRLAVREVARDESRSIDARVMGVMTLLDNARQEYKEDPFVLNALRGVIRSEAHELIYERRTPKAPAVTWQGPPIIARLRALRHRGYSRCQECWRTIPDRDLLAYWDDLDRAGWAELVLRERAVERPA